MMGSRVYERLTNEGNGGRVVAFFHLTPSGSKHGPEGNAWGHWSVGGLVCYMLSHRKSPVQIKPTFSRLVHC